MRKHPLEVKLKKEGFLKIAGLDEAGRGPWAGPLVAAAVILEPNIKLPNLKDSKKLTAKQREIIFEILQKEAYIGIGIVKNTEIDKKNLGFCIKLAYRRAINQIPIKPDHLLIDGIGKYNFKISYKTVKFGDNKVRCIAAASIVAKVVRDNLMDSYCKIYPNYAFSSHKGYGTRQHQKKLLKYGMCPLHRQSFKPLQIMKNVSKKT